MTLTTIYKKPLESKYRTPTCSVAMFFHILSVVAIVIFPAIIGFYTRNLWVSEMTYLEKPDVQFKYKMLIFLQDKDGGSHVWSTWSYYNTLVQDILTVPSVSVDELDVERDGLVDVFNITLQFEKSDVVSFQALLVFQYKLSKVCQLVMETPVYINKKVKEQEVTVFGDLGLHQRENLQPHNPNTEYNTSLIQDTNLLQSFEIAGILERVSTRAVVTTLDELYTVGEPSSTFTSSFILNIPQHRIRYEPGFWEAMKHAWIQYIALLVIVKYVVCKVRAFVFENMIFTTLRNDDKTKTS